MSFKVSGAIGPYQIIEQIGQGGMGTVFKAYHQDLDRFVALKVLHPAHQEDPTFIGRFQREARLVAKLEHPNIVPIYDFAKAENLSYLVMKFIEGSTLKHDLARGPLSFNEVTQVVNSVGSALAYAHRQGVLHRDIKPSNILIGTDGIMYLADFGLARIMQAEASTLSADSIIGTPHYISPEQATGKDSLTEKTDIYSFGIMLYEIIVGQIPFDANTPFSIIHDHIYSPLPLPRILNPNVSEPVEHVLLKALAKDPNDRYENVIQMVSDFNNAWLSAQYGTQGSLPVDSASFHNVQKKSAAQKSSANYAIAEHTLEPKQTTNLKKGKFKWIYFGIAIALAAGLLFAFIPNFRNNLISNLRFTNTPTSMASSETTPAIQELNIQPTSGTQVTSTTAPQSINTLTSQSTNTTVSQPTNTPVPQATNTSAPKPTAQPTQPAQNILTPPPLINTVVNPVINTPTIIPPVIP
jgi:serine/threonine-protein kinase